MIIPFRQWLQTASPACAERRFESTGLAALDAQLPGHGWPQASVTELCATHADIGALSALVPTMARLTREDRKVALMAPENLAEVEQLGEQGVRLRHVTVLRAHEENTLWAMEQKLRSGEIAMLVAWVDRLGNGDVRRLQAAAAASGAMVMLFRKPGAARFARASTLHLLLRPGTDGLLDIEILKPRGQRAGTVTAQGTRHQPRRQSASLPRLAWSA